MFLYTYAYTGFFCISSRTRSFSSPSSSCFSQFLAASRHVTETLCFRRDREARYIYGSERASIGISVEKVDAQYEWRGAPIENGITKNLSTFVRACHGYRRLAGDSCVATNSMVVDNCRERDGVSRMTYIYIYIYREQRTDCC